MAQLKSSSQTRIDAGDDSVGAAAEIAAGRTNSVKRADGTWSARVRNLPQDYPLQTWADDLAIGAYDVELLIAQNGLPVGWWYIEVMRYNNETVTSQFRYLRATPLNPSISARPVHHCSTVNGAWSAWTPMDGKTLQVVSRTITTRGSQTIAANTDTQVGAGTDFILNVIPVATGSSFLIEYRWFGEVASAWDIVFNVHRDGVRVNNTGLIKAGLSMATQTYGVVANDDSTPEIMHLRTLDKSGSTAGTPIQFKLVAAAMSAAKTMWTNRCFNANAANGYEHGVSEIIITEIAA